MQWHNEGGVGAQRAGCFYCCRELKTFRWDTSSVGALIRPWAYIVAGSSNLPRYKSVTLWLHSKHVCLSVSLQDQSDRDKVNTLLSSLDADKNGEVDFEEYMSMLSSLAIKCNQLLTGAPAHRQWGDQPPSSSNSEGSGLNCFPYYNHSKV